MSEMVERIEKIVVPMCVVALVLVGVAKIVSPIVKSYVEADFAAHPSIEFRGEQAYLNCEAMGSEARRQGYHYWSCSKP